MESKVLQQRDRGLPSLYAGSSKLEVSYGTVLSALQNVIQSKDGNIHGILLAMSSKPTSCLAQLNLSGISS